MELPTLSVSTELPVPGAAIGLTLKLAVVPAGTPEAESAMELLNVPLAVVLMVVVPGWP